MSGPPNRPHTLSPSAWNRFEACPRQYWLSRQGLPKKAGMAASLGTAVHASIEDLAQIDLTNRDDAETNWMPSLAADFLKHRWEEEKSVFMKTPRRPKWKEEDYPKAKKHQVGAIHLLLKFVKLPTCSLEEITIGMWKKVLSCVLAVEAELRTSDDKLMGRLDLLMAEKSQSGEVISWVVADLKTGRAPKNELKPEVQRQLLLYRDILLSNNPNAPPLKTQGWYSENAHAYSAEGDSVMDDALRAWESSHVTENPLEATPGPTSCGGFCDWKAWCPHWMSWQRSSGMQSDFVDMVVLIHSYQTSNGLAIAEFCEALDTSGRVIPTGDRKPLRFDHRAKEVFEVMLEQGHKGPVFISGVMAKGETLRAGHWCDVLPFSPIPDA
ncbi:MAG: PD-(D/E)XK nuclease family protein [Candidatus Thermoplasmatota archaeon]|nr:PD-(D/E)XK nuclease family protein [Candidatus Thermoplasmatota archaeon]|tara:strand:- start:713 stop:1858 length:1146 start_codon:yes stop_codon:yes gene_type:complete